MSKKKEAEEDFQKMFQELEGDPDFIAQKARFHFAFELAREMKSYSIDKETLAEKTGFTVERITRILRGIENLDLDTMAKLISALPRKRALVIEIL